MPNRGPLEFTRAELVALLAELPPSRPLSEAEDDEDRQLIRLHDKLRERMAEQRNALASDDARGTVVFSIDEADGLLDCLPPPPALAEVRARLGAFHQAMLA
jgi:hypothetical protein